MSEFAKDAAGVAKAAGITTGAGLGVAASGSVWGTAMATGTAAIVSPALVCLALPVVGAYLGWKAVKTVTDPFVDKK